MLVARTVLTDCSRTIALLEETESEDDFRVYYVAAMALARAVGHVLHKVDAPRSALLKKAIDDAYSEWRVQREHHAIFWNFIELERNNILKAYEFGYQSNPQVVVSTLESDESFVLGDNLFLPLSDGPFAGEDVRDKLRDALAWWDTQLGKIEKSSSGNI